MKRWKATFYEVPHKHFDLPRTLSARPQVVRGHRWVRLILVRHIQGEQFRPLLPMALLLGEPLLSSSDRIPAGHVPPLLLQLFLL